MSRSDERRIRNIIPEKAEKSPAPFDSLACVLLDDIRKFFQDPENEAEYQEYKRRSAAS